MFNKTLQRPMFRRGGSTAGKGVMSMVEPRGMYADSNYEDLIAKQKEYTDRIRTSAQPSNAEKALLIAQIASTPGNTYEKIKASIPLTSNILGKQRAAENLAGKTELENMMDIEKLKIAGMDKSGMTPSKVKEFNAIKNQLISVQKNRLGRELTAAEIDDVTEAAQSRVWPTERKTKSDRDNYNDMFKFKAEDISLQQDNVIKAIQNRDFGKYNKSREKLESTYNFIKAYSGIDPLDNPTLKIPIFDPDKYSKIDKKADGGRMGYAYGAPDTGVQPAAPTIPVQQEAMSMAQASGPQTQTQEIKSFTFQELRTKLPPEVTDDIVRLLSGSKDALRDFAYITTQNDINEFNKKYGVNLTLPAQ
jgi:hypothetical protein